MLGLNDTTRFSVTDLDTDLAGDRLDSLSVALQTSQSSQFGQTHSSYLRVAPATMALTVPALRSTGPQVVWTGYATAEDAGFTGLLGGQKELRGRLTSWLALPTTAELPVVYAEQLIRGHRFDVYTASETTPAWRSLCGRYGQIHLRAVSSRAHRCPLRRRGHRQPRSEPEGRDHRARAHRPLRP